jgi:mono/diheme cytochrome c family protein
MEEAAMEEAAMKSMLPALAVLAFLVAACAAPHPQRPSSGDMSDAQALVSDGRDIAEAQCAGCHAVGSYGDSPNTAAPTFRTVLSRYRADVLEQELIEGIRVSHPMPAFQFDPRGVDALIAYLQSIQQERPRDDRRSSR